MAGSARRFYQEVSLRAGAGGHEVLLDGRPVRTPAKNLLTLPAKDLAEAIAEEWRAQEDEIRPDRMPIMSMTCTGIDHVMPRQGEIAEQVAAYAAHDLVCYWAGDQPELMARQQALWQPLLDWAALNFDAPLTVVKGILPIEQPESSRQALAAVVRAHAPLPLAALGAATQAAGSLIIGLALMRGRLSVDGAFESCLVDELYQAELWGADQEAKARREAIREELATAARFMALLPAS